MPKPLPESSPLPYRYEGHMGSILLLHGFTGTPYELKPLAEALHQAGFSCMAPLLPGHGTTPADLNKTRHNEWIDAARQSFRLLARDQPRIVCGLSMGALLATLLAAEFNAEIDALVLISPAFELRPLGRISAALSRLGLYHVLPSVKKKLGSDIADPQGRAMNPAYGEIPLRGLVEFDALRRLAQKQLSHVKCPTFSAFGEQDHTVDRHKALALLQHFLKTPIHNHLFHRSFHVLPLDFDRDELIESAVNFCKTNA